MYDPLHLGAKLDACVSPGFEATCAPRAEARRGRVAPPESEPTGRPRPTAHGQRSDPLGVIKQRIARKGGGLSGEFRTIMLFRRGELAFFVYGFTKSDRDNLRRDELETFRLLANEYLALDRTGLAAAQSIGAIIELECDELSSTRVRRWRAAHEAALGLAAAGVMSKKTMRVFDELCLTPVESMSPENIRALRLRENASHAVFARCLDVTTGLVSQWKRGEKRPRAALR